MGMAGSAGSKTDTSDWYAARDAGAAEGERLRAAGRIVGHPKLLFDALAAAVRTSQRAQVDNVVTSLRLLIFLLFLCG